MSTRIALINDVPLVVAGLRRVLSERSDRFEVVDIELGGTDVAPVDIAIFDTAFGDEVVQRVRRMRDDGTVGHLVVYTWNAPAAIRRIEEESLAVHVIEKSVGGDLFVEALEEIAEAPSGHLLRIAAIEDRRRRLPVDLSEQETRVIVSVAHGFTNPEIAESLAVSAETVKTYLRRAMEKLAVTSRSEVASWAGMNGLVVFD